MKERTIILCLVILLILVSLSVGLNKLGASAIGTAYEEARKTAHNIYVLTVYRRGEDIIYRDTAKLITMNPPIKDNLLLVSFMSLILPFYILAIVGIGFYLIFLSSSPARSSRAKAMFGKLVIGMIITSIAPKILELVIGLSEYCTYRILDLMPMSAYVQVIRDFSENFSTTFLFVNQTVTDIGFIFPGVWIWYLFWGTFFVFILRYIVIVLFTALLPLMIFFYSFEMTKDLGRSILEQLILWIFLQEFIATVVIAVVLCMNSGFGDAFNISGFGNFLLFTAAGFIVLAPFMMTRIFRNFIPG